jgi:hypothetical protein
MRAVRINHRRRAVPHKPGALKNQGTDVNFQL